MSKPEKQTNHQQSRLRGGYGIGCHALFAVDCVQDVKKWTVIPYHKASNSLRPNPDTSAIDGEPHHQGAQNHHEPSHTHDAK